MVKLVKQPEVKEKKINKETILKIPKYLIPAITPFLCFVIMEYIWRYKSNGVLTSNPFATIPTVLLIFNLLLFYGFWGLLFAVIGRSNIASYITIALSFIIGLANYYIMDFRNAPITAADFCDCTVCNMPWRTKWILQIQIAKHEKNIFKNLGTSYSCCFVHLLDGGSY